MSICSYIRRDKSPRTEGPLGRPHYRQSPDPYEALTVDRSPLATTAEAAIAAVAPRGE
jgi:hypothetical protein